MKELASLGLCETHTICITLVLGKKNVNISPLEMQGILIAWVGHGHANGGIQNRHGDFECDEVDVRNR